MKKWLLSLLTFALIFVLVACSGSGDSSSESSGDNGGSGEEQITLRMAWWGGQPRHDYTMELIEMYEAENPHVKIEPEFANWDDYWKKLSPMAAAGTLPDIIQMDTAYIAQYGQNGQLAELGPFIEDGTIDTTNIDENSLTSGMLDGKLYGFSTGSNVLTVISNTDMLAESGVEIDDTNWTWEDFVEYALAIHDATDKYGTNGMYPADVFFPYYLKTKGERFYNEDGTGLAYQDDQLFIDYFNMQLELVDAGAFPTPDVQSQIKGMEDDFIVKGDAALTWNWSNQYVGFSALTEFPLKLNLLPEAKGTDAVFLRASMFWSIAENSKHKEEAAKFINWYTNSIEANEKILGDRGVPLSSEVVSAMSDVLSDDQKVVFDYVERAKEYAGPADPPDPVGAAEVMSALSDISEEILFGATSPEDGAKKFRDRATEILGRNAN